MIQLVSASPPSLMQAVLRSSFSALRLRRRFPPPTSPPSRFFSAYRESRGFNKEIRRVVSEIPLRSYGWSDIILPSAVLGAIGSLVFFIRHNDELRAIRKESVDEAKQRKEPCNKPAFGGPFKLVGTDYSVVTESELRGSWSLLYFGYTSSPDVGSEELQKMAEVLNMLESQHNVKIKAVFISIDPMRDNPTHLKAYLEEFDPRIMGLTGSVDAIRQVAREYRVFFKKVDEDAGDYLIDTSSDMYLLNPSLEVVKCFTVMYDANQLCDGVLEEIRKASGRDQTHVNCDGLH